MAKSDFSAEQKMDILREWHGAGWGKKKALEIAGRVGRSYATLYYWRDTIWVDDEEDGQERALGTTDAGATTPDDSPAVDNLGESWRYAEEVLCRLNVARRQRTPRVVDALEQAFEALAKVHAVKLEPRPVAPPNTRAANEDVAALRRELADLQATNDHLEQDAIEWRRRGRLAEERLAAASALHSEQCGNCAAVEARNHELIEHIASLSLEEHRLRRILAARA